MCRYYQTTRKPAYTRLCYRYRDLRGAHVLGQYRCGEYPRPSRRSSAPTSSPARLDSMCRCGQPAISSDRKCEKCYLYDQIIALPEDARINVAPQLMRDAAEHQQKRERHIDTMQRISNTTFA